MIKRQDMDPDTTKIQDTNPDTINIEYMDPDIIKKDMDLVSRYNILILTLSRYKGMDPDIKI